MVNAWFIVWTASVVLAFVVVLLMMIFGEPKGCLRSKTNKKTGIKTTVSSVCVGTIGVIFYREKKKDFSKSKRCTFFKQGETMKRVPRVGDVIMPGEFDKILHPGAKQKNDEERRHRRYVVVETAQRKDKIFLGSLCAFSRTTEWSVCAKELNSDGTYNSYGEEIHFNVDVVKYDSAQFITHDKLTLVGRMV